MREGASQDEGKGHLRVKRGHLRVREGTSQGEGRGHLW